MSDRTPRYDVWITDQRAGRVFCDLWSSDTSYETAARKAQTAAHVNGIIGAEVIAWPKGDAVYSIASSRGSGLDWATNADRPWPNQSNT